MSDSTLSDEENMVFEHARAVEKAMTELGLGLMHTRTKKDFNSKLDDIARNLRNMKI
jgi:hypothetical protein